MTVEVPTRTAMYEIDSPDVLASAAWDEAVEQGRWPGEVRPHTFNRHHKLFRKLQGLTATPARPIVVAAMLLPLIRRSRCADHRGTALKAPTGPMQ